MISPALQALLDRLGPSPGGLDIAQLWDALYSARYTGPVTFDFAGGVPRQINLGHPVKLAICAGDGRTPDVPVDSRRKT